MRVAAARKSSPDRCSSGSRLRLRAGTLLVGLAALSSGLAAGQPLAAGPTAAERMNAGLSYAPWTGQCAPTGLPSGGAGLLRILPGMRLRMTQSELESKGEQGAYPTLAEIEWVIPAVSGGGPGGQRPVHERLTRRDFVVLSHLLGAGERDLLGHCVDADCRVFPAHSLNGLDTSVGSAFESALDAFVKTTLSSLALRRVAPPPMTPRKTASVLRGWLFRGGHDDFVAGRSGSAGAALETRLVLAREGEPDRLLSALAPRFANNPDRLVRRNEPGPGAGQPANAYYTDDYTLPRASIEIDVPVASREDVRPRFVPIYWSLRDVEKAWNVRVVSLLRDARWICSDLRAGVKPEAGGAIRITVDGQKRFMPKPAEILFPEDERDELLVAPRDVVTVAPAGSQPAEWWEYR